MLKMRKFLVLFLVMLLSFTLVACNGSSKTSSENSKSDPSTKVNENGEIDTSEFVTITMMTLGDKPTNGQLEKVMEQVNAKLKEKANAHLEIKWIEWADYMTKYNLTLASGEPVDLIITATDWLDAWGNAQKGAFMDITELLPTYAPQTWGEVSEENWEQTKYEDKIVMIPEDSYTQWVNHGFFYRTDWAKEFGITEPIKDFETLGEYFQGIVDNKPGVIPWDTPGTNVTTAWGYTTSYSDAIELPIATGVFPIYWAQSYDEAYNVMSPVFEDTFVDYAKLMKDWADKGYWRADVLNYKGDTRALFQAGKTGADQHHTETFSGLRTQMDLKQPGSEIDMFAWSDTRDNLISMSVTHGATAVGAHSENPERALMVYDLLRNDEEIYKLFNYGIEGVQYEIADGKRVRPEGYDETKDSFASNFWGGRVDKFEIPSSDKWEGVSEMYAEYDKIKKPYPYGRFVFDSTPVEAELAALSQVTAQMVPAIAFGKAGDPEKAVKDLRNRLEAAGYEKVLKEIQKQMDEYKKLVEGN
ncbi:extracellular solute-binding protein [Metabacillus litoralis]|uniref:ABC transporter substrate-binding protein n=1 Tax=Metabacillus litoralis TaxID=152268 RepID=A0A179T4G0_9BACI|nr:extracellular solute-binding protein [Metabacillus litoralis]OAS88270.1 ABC transporter substrate-binding protein [Metabacillus litoralis]